MKLRISENDTCLRHRTGNTAFTSDSVQPVGPDIKKNLQGQEGS